MAWAHPTLEPHFTEGRRHNRRHSHLGSGQIFPFITGELREAQQESEGCVRLIVRDPRSRAMGRFVPPILQEVRESTKSYSAGRMRACQRSCSQSCPGHWPIDRPEAHSIRLRSSCPPERGERRFASRAAHGAAGKISVSALATNCLLSALMKGGAEPVLERVEKSAEALRFGGYEEIGIGFAEPLRPEWRDRVPRAGAPRFRTLR